MSLIQGAIKEGYGDRAKTSKLLKMRLNSIGDRSFGGFQIQVIMRTVEHCCLEGPFGEVKNITAGYGGRCGANCMLEACLNYIKNNYPNEIIPDKVEEQRMKVAEWLVIMRNDRARNGLNSPDPAVRRRMSDELIVCNLEWSYEEDCLVHKNGLKRKYNASNAEHSLCALYVLLVTVRPERNMSVKSKIDGPKYAPLRLPPGKGI